MRHLLSCGPAFAACVFALASMAVSCSDDDKADPTPACNPGDQGCACIGGTDCNDALACDRGYCVPGSACPAGTRLCACLADGTCNAASGPLTCQNSVCVDGAGPAEGTVGGACYPNGTCDPGLDCASGLCAEPGCPNGTLGCACGAGGACTDATATCDDDNVCTVAGCSAGQAGCACNGGACDAGLTCESDLCRPAGSGIGVTVGNPDVRSCDILLYETDRKVTGVVYTAQALGKHQREGSRVALAFFARDDVSFAGQVATVQVDGDAPIGASTFTVKTARCNDREGRVVSTPQITLGE